MKTFSIASILALATSISATSINVSLYSTEPYQDNCGSNVQTFNGVIQEGQCQGTTGFRSFRAFGAEGPYNNCQIVAYATGQCGARLSARVQYNGESTGCIPVIDENGNYAQAKSVRLEC